MPTAFTRHEKDLTLTGCGMVIESRVSMQHPASPSLAPSDPPGSRRTGGLFLLQCMAIFLVGFLAVSPSLDGGWLWDDDQQISANLNLRDLDGLRRIWTEPSESDYYPVKSLIAWGLWQLWGPVPTGYRVFNLVCHLTGALLIWRLLGRLGLRWGWLGGLLFAAHPLTVESVAWISQIKNTVSLPFLLLAMLGYIDYDERRRSGRLVGAVLFFLAAMLSKSSVVMFPAVALLYCWWKRGTLDRRDILSVLPFAGISLIFGCVTIWFQNTRAIGEYPIPDLGWVARLAGAGVNAWFYLVQFFLPVGLSPIYPHWKIDPPAAWQLLTVPAFAILFRWFWTRRAGWGRHAVLGLGFFLLNLLPVLGLQPMAFMAFSWVSDHFVYLPMIGLIGLVVAGAEAAYRRLRNPWKNAEITLLGAVVVILTTLSHAHAAVFRNAEALWTRAVERYPESAPALNSLGAAQLEQERVFEALANIGEALKRRADFPEARNNLGLALWKLGRKDEALVQFREALRLKPWLASAHFNAGSLVLEESETDPSRLPEAIAHLEDATKLHPAHTGARSALGLALMMAGRPEEAAAELQKARELAPWKVEIHNNFGKLFLQQGDAPEAEKHFRRAIALDARCAVAYNNLGVALFLMGRPAEALSAFQTALDIDPAYRNAQANRDLLLMRLREKGEAGTD
jgi:Flp pilus assembly protein TadD